MPNAAEKARLARLAAEEEKRQKQQEKESAEAEKAAQKAAKEQEKERAKANKVNETVKKTQEKAAKKASAQRAKSQKAQRRARNRQDSYGDRDTGPSQVPLYVLIAIAVFGFLVAISLFVGIGVNNLIYLNITNVLFYVDIGVTVLCAILIIVISNNYATFYRHMTKLNATFVVLGITSLVAISAYHLNGRREYRGEGTLAGVRYLIHPDCADVIGCNEGVTEIVIPEKVEGLPVRKVRKEAFQGNEKLQRIVVEGGITFEEKCFADCSALTSIEMQQGTFTLQSSAFYNCRFLQYVHVQDGTLEYIPGNSGVFNYPFSHCHGDLTLEMDAVIIDEPDMYVGRYLTDFTTIKLGARSSIYTVEMVDVENLVLKDDFRFETGSVKIVTGLFNVVSRPLAKNIYFPASLDRIGAGIFGNGLQDGVTRLEAHYGGTMESWYSLPFNKTDNGTYDQGLVTMHYLSTYPY